MDPHASSRETSQWVLFFAGAGVGPSVRGFVRQVAHSEREEKKNKERNRKPTLIQRAVIGDSLPTAGCQQLRHHWASGRSDRGDVGSFVRMD